MKRQKPCSEQSTQSAASMKGALLVLALMVTRELIFQTSEGRKEGPRGPSNPCPMPFHCIFPSPVRAASRVRFRGPLFDQCPGVLHRLP